MTRGWFWSKAIESRMNSFSNSSMTVGVSEFSSMTSMSFVERKIPLRLLLREPPIK